MKKRLVAFLCVVMLLVGLLPAGAATVASAETTTGNDKYYVGYSIKNITPWVSAEFVENAFKTSTGKVKDPNTNNDITVEYISGVDTYTDNEDGKQYYYIGKETYNGEPLFNGYSETNNVVYPYLGALVGNQVNWKNFMTEVFDDSGDGKINNDDGIFATCTAVTYGEKTVLFITVDTMKAYSVDTIRNNIVAKYGEKYGITKDQIMISSNHTHSSLQLTTSFGGTMATIFTDETDASGISQKKALEANRGHYLDWALGQITAAAGDALANRATATMSKGSINATEATAAMNYNDGEGYQMNAIRHYEKTATVTRNSDSEVMGTKTYISSNATPSDEAIIKEVTGSTEYSDYTVTTVTTTSDIPDNTMYVLRFDFDEGNQPVVFVNWRAHSTMNSGIYKADPNTSDKDDRPYLSSDYANGLRTVLRDEFGCRAAFFLGAAGNVTPAPTDDVYGGNTHAVKANMDWLYEATKKDANGKPKANNDGTYQVDKDIRTFTYGKLLAEIANHCMTAENKSYMTEVTAGEISTYQCSWNGKRQIFSEALKEAAEQLGKDVETPMSEAGYTDILKYFSDFGKLWFPYHYKYTDPNTGTTETVTINTRLHYNKVNNQSDNPSATVSGIELNAIILGPDVAFIVSPGELVDYFNDFSKEEYEEGLTQEEINALNDWNDLIDDSYGMPFFAGYSNGTTGYIASWLDYNSNSKDFIDITGKGEDGPSIYSPGTYESLTSDYAIGEGEALIDFFDEMLDRAAGKFTRTGVFCEHCGTLEDWQPLYAENAGDTTYTSGHYYLCEDFPKETSSQRHVEAGGTVCIDLNGHHIENGRTSNGRFFVVSNDATLTVLDSKGGGTVKSHPTSNNPGGGLLSIGSSNPSTAGTMNIYGGTWSFENTVDSPHGGTGTGGIASVSAKGELNIYGGTIQGAEMFISDYSLGNNGCGGAFYLSNGATLAVSGDAHIISGSVPKMANGATKDGFGPCVYMAGASCKVTLSENAKVDDIYYAVSSTTALTISGDYTGTVGLSFATTPTDDMDIGESENAVLTGSTITCTNNPFATVYVNGSDLLLSESNAVAMVYGSSGVKAYGSLNDAIAQYTDGYIKLIKDETATVSVTKDVYLDLNGFDVSEVNVTSGTLYCKDSMTDDYTVADNEYGRIKEYSGSVKGIPEDATVTDVTIGDDKVKDGYLMITETDGTSFHRVNLQIYAMTLRPEVEPGIYYKSHFAGDEKVAAKVKKFGVAMSVSGIPEADNLDTKCLYSTFENFESGEGDNDNNNTCTDTLLYGIMKKTNMPLINSRNANIKIYGRAYILIDDGKTYMFGGHVSRTLREQVELVNELCWSSMSNAQKDAVVDMCNTFSSVTKNWDIGNILEEIEEQQN